MNRMIPNRYRIGQRGLGKVRRGQDLRERLQEAWVEGGRRLGLCEDEGNEVADAV